MSSGPKSIPPKGGIPPQEHHCATPKAWSAAIVKVARQRMRSERQPVSKFLLFLIARELYTLKRADGTLTPCAEHPGMMVANG